MRGIAAGRPEAARVELWLADEARVGQKGRTTHIRRQKGVRPRGARERRFASAHLFGAACPERDAGVALVLPEVSTAAMNLLLAELARAVPEDAHAVVVLDRAGWHVSGGLAVPTSLTLVHLPPYSPELDPVERVWLYLRERWLSTAYSPAATRPSSTPPARPGNALRAEPGRLRSLAAFPWLPSAVINS